MLVANVIAGPSLLVILSAIEESLAQGKLRVAIRGMASRLISIAMTKTIDV